jgi:hypothetical protein
VLARLAQVRKLLGEALFWGNWGVFSVLGGIFMVAAMIVLGLLLLGRP